MTEHTVKSFGEELERLSSEIAGLGGMAEAMVSDVVKAFVNRDVPLAENVIARDDDVDNLQKELERDVIRMFALRQPMASDLRATISALKIATDLERIADLSKNIAKRTLLLSRLETIGLTRSMEHMGMLVVRQLKDVLDSYSRTSVELAVNVWFRDEEVDEHYNSLFRELLTYMMEDPRTISVCAHFLFVAKNLERIGDHATNIAEVVHYLVTGENMAHERPKQDGLTKRF